MTDDLLTRRPHTPEEQEALQDRMSLLVGDVARASAVVELHLRQLMQALIDSKYAEVTAAGLAANELIETCAALVKINREITEAQRSECLAHLSALKPLYTRRNQLIHGLWAPAGMRTDQDEPAEALALVSKRRTATKAVNITFVEAEELARSLRETGMSIFRWVCGALLPQLQREQVTAVPEVTE
ncbi:hypothetical protein [Streptomyces sp. NPDC085529]|uniref:hypothetical protein n=1 Tax=Streptomyces sp. NPDC085529 TaxID=3365729 RepID=UPI0037D00F81